MTKQEPLQLLLEYFWGPSGAVIFIVACAVAFALDSGEDEPALGAGLVGAGVGLLIVAVIYFITTEVIHYA